MQHDKLDEVVDGMLGSSIGQNMTSAEREQMKTMFQKQVCVYRIRGWGRVGR